MVLWRDFVGLWCGLFRLQLGLYPIQVSKGAYHHLLPHSANLPLDLSGTWRTCNANLAGGHHQELAALEIVRVLREHGIELIDLGLQLSSWEPKEDYAGVG